MIKLVENKEESNSKMKDSQYFYEFQKDNNTLGWATINKDDENKLYIFIDENFRGNGYGKLLFSEMMKELRNKDYKQFKVIFNKENIPMLKIVEDNNGLQIGADTKLFKFEIPIKIS